MTTSEFITFYEGAVEELKRKCLVLDDGKVCSDGIKCDVKVKGYAGAEDFAKKNSAFLVKEFSAMLDSADASGLEPDDVCLRLCVENEADGKCPAWKGEILYVKVVPVAVLGKGEGGREKFFEYPFDDYEEGFLVYDKYRVLKEEKEETPQSVKECECGRECENGRGDCAKCDADAEGCICGLPDPEDLVECIKSLTDLIKDVVLKGQSDKDDDKEAVSEPRSEPQSEAEPESEPKTGHESPFASAE